MSHQVIKYKTYVIVLSKSPIDWIDTINYYKKNRYVLTQLFYKRKWLWSITYYAYFIYPTTPPPPLLPHIEFIIGPVKNRNIPKPPLLPHIEFIIGPVKNK